MKVAGAATNSPTTREAAGPRWRLAIAIALAGVLIVFVLYAGLGVYGDTQIVHQPRKPVTLNPHTIAPQVEDVSFSSRPDHVTLKGWWFPGKASGIASGNALILLHGRGQNRADSDFGLDQIAHAMYDQGYALLMFDQRAHGASAGGVQSYGLNEQNDVLGAFDFVRGKGYQPDQIGMIGVSYGAAAMLMAAPWLPDIGAMVSDSAYAEAWPVVTRQIRKQRPELAWLKPDFAVSTAIRIMDGVNLPVVKPVDAVRSAPHTPILFIHGADDDYVPLKNSEDLRRASTDRRSDLWLVPGAAHGETYKHDPADWLRHVSSFLNGRLYQRPQP